MLKDPTIRTALPVLAATCALLLSTAVSAQYFGH